MSGTDSAADSHFGTVRSESGAGRPRHGQSLSGDRNHRSAGGLCEGKEQNGGKLEGNWRAGNILNIFSNFANFKYSLKTILNTSPPPSPSLPFRSVATASTRCGTTRPLFALCTPSWPFCASPSATERPMAACCRNASLQCAVSGPASGTSRCARRETNRLNRHFCSFGRMFYKHFHYRSILSHLSTLFTPNLRMSLSTSLEGSFPNPSLL